LLAFTIGPRIWKLASRMGYYTVGDFLEDRYQKVIRHLVAILLWLGALAILAGQLIGMSKVLSAVAAVPKETGCIVAGVCVTLYFAAGGLFSAAWVNVVQLAVKLSGFALAMPIAVNLAGGWKGIAAATASNGA